jgi:acetyl/propionyl-CoA carboxylase alpha subunit
MAHPRWREGRLSTAFIAEEFPDGFRGAEPGQRERIALAAIAVTAALAERARFNPQTDADAPRETLVPHPRSGGGGPPKAVEGADAKVRRSTIGPLHPAPHGPLPPSFTTGEEPNAIEPHAIAPSRKACEGDWVLALGRDRLPVHVAADPNGVDAWLLTLDAMAPVAVASDWRPGMRVWRGSVDGESIVAQVERHGNALRVSRRGVSCLARLLTPRAAELDRLMAETGEADSVNALLCPMPGLVVSIAVAEGQKVEPGEALATVEAMKMENVLRADRPATVTRILARPGDSLAVDAVIMEFG